MIAQIPVERVSYHHLELEAHNVLLAEGLPAESYLATQDWPNYADPAAAMAREPTARNWEALGCAPLIVSGPRLTAARALLARSATTETVAPMS